MFSIFKQDGMINPNELFRDIFFKLDPRLQFKNPVMFMVLLSATYLTYLLIVPAQEIMGAEVVFVKWICVWLWLTILFANFSEALAEGRGKAQALSLKKTNQGMMARRVKKDDTEELIPSSLLQRGDIVRVSAGEQIPADGEVIEGVASVDESSITGESAPVIRESGGDRSSVTGGTRVLSDILLIRIEQDPGKGFVDRMISLVEGAKRQKTPNEIALSILLAALTLIFFIVCATLIPFSQFSAIVAGRGNAISTPILISLFVCLAPTTIGALVSAIGISGMDRLLRKNVVAKSGRAVEASGDIDVLLLDKTGTITYGNRQASRIVPFEGISLKDLATASYMASMTDDTPEGKSIVSLALSILKVDNLEIDKKDYVEIPFTAQTKMSGADISGVSYRKGAGDSIKKRVMQEGGSWPDYIQLEVDKIARVGSTPLLIMKNSDVLGVVELKDIVKPNIKERFQQLRQMGVKTIMITGDNPLTASAIAIEAGLDDFHAEATPESKMELIKSFQEGGRLVAMTGDGTNDAPALAQADVAVAMNSGTQAAKDAGNMVDLDSNPTKLIEIVETGKQLLMTRGALTAFSLANDVAKYFAIIPAAFVGIYPTLAILNVMNLATPRSAVLSSVIFNAVVIIFLIPLALKGVKYRPDGALVVLRRNMLVYGLGGFLTPFLGIKLIDLLIVNLLGAI